MFQEGEINVYKINLDLPLGYMVDKEFMSLSWKEDMFGIQNRLIDGEDVITMKSRTLKYDCVRWKRS